MLGRWVLHCQEVKRPLCRWLPFALAVLDGQVANVYRSLTARIAATARGKPM